MEWLVETRPSFSPPRTDMKMPDDDLGAAEVYSHRLDVLNDKFEQLRNALIARINEEANGNGDMVSRFFMVLFL